MRIAVDARELEGRRTGVGRVVDETLRAFGRSLAGRRHSFVLCSSTPLDLAPYAPLDVTAAQAPGHGIAWEQITLPRLVSRAGADLLFAPGYTAPLLMGRPTVLIVHDVSFSAHPEWFSWREGARRRTFTRLAARRAARVVTVSQVSKDEIVAHLGVEPRKISVVPNGLTRITTRTTATADTPTVLFVGSIFNRRHIPELIAAVGLLGRQGLPVRLEIVGDNRTNPPVNLADLALAEGLADRVEVRNYVRDNQLADCYGRARAFAFISSYEGFGLTPLEALSAGVPVLVLDNRLSREVYGDAATYVTATTPEAIAAGLATVLFDDAERARALRHAAVQLSRYDWATTASQLLQLFETVAGEQGDARGKI